MYKQGRHRLTERSTPKAKLLARVTLEQTLEHEDIARRIQRRME